MDGLRDKGSALVARLRAQLSWRRLALASAVAGGFCLGGMAVLLYWPMDADRYVTLCPSGEMVDREGRLLHPVLNADEQWCFVRDLDGISPYLVQATIAAEDQRYRAHHGVDPVAVVRAAWQNLWGRRVVSGASTITMQVVKQTDQCTRSLSGKAYQAAQALRLERRIDKDRILWAYVNSAPYGLNLVGCEAAARRYFGKPARELTLPEAALLAGLPKAPTALMPLANPDKARRRRDYVLDRMRDEGFITVAQWDAAKSRQIEAQWHAFPRLSPHLAMRLGPVLGRGRQVATTLDRDLQAMAESYVSHRLKAFDGEVTNAALIVVDAADATVLARVGSADFFGTPGGGQVDACRARRSPGSALKPFTYALAMERNRLYPSEMLLDGTLDFGRYRPENYDGHLRGLVRARRALPASLNVPAVIALNRIGVAALHELLGLSGLTTLNEMPEHYGLGLTLGNCEVRLDEMVAAYCMLANLGEYRPLRELADTPRHAPIRHLSSDTCFMVYTMLDQPFPSEASSDLVKASGIAPRVCWKTGTSTGHHDAWTFVFNQHYVVGVWLGNNDATASRRLVGAEAALPLASRIFRALPPRPEAAWPAAGSMARRVSVCAASGLPASQWCPHVRDELLPRRQYVHRVCAVHRPAGIAQASAGARVVEQWPGTAKGWDLAAIQAPVTLAASDGAPKPTRTEALRIVTPPNEAEFVLTGESGGDRLRVRAS
ncbi:MAG: penicillin-binding protein 1C, partial [bacterium]|nr:penicillin-binding protein 1C [bacterium]